MSEANFSISFGVCPFFMVAFISKTDGLPFWLSPPVLPSSLGWSLSVFMDFVRSHALYSYSYLLPGMTMKSSFRFPVHLGPPITIYASHNHEMKAFVPKTSEFLPVFQKEPRTIFPSFSSLGLELAPRLLFSPVR